ncbi:MAG: rRNA pseudouridine synthase [Ruminococcus sp.]|nr:rRNA pseudouridine synthase [Ruminococcus sp.]MCD7727691.1 rRNA pseudouridine synthase [Ruminococcus sp.]
MEKQRIQKLIAEAGFCSRRKAEELIVQGRVKVNGRPCKLGDKADFKSDISIDGERLPLSHKRQLYYIMLNKPRGYVTTMSDELDRKNVSELVKGVPERVYPVGRLDKNSEGLLLFTNDGVFANDIMHPSKHVTKTYRVTVRPPVSEEQLVKMSEGVLIDGRKTLPCVINVLTSESNRVVLQMVIKEGRNRQIRKMCDAVGLEVARLKRTAIGPVKLGMLKPGDYRELTSEELRALRTAISKSK